MKQILVLILSFYSFFAIGQSKTEFEKYPREFKKVKHFKLLSSLDTFDKFEHILLLSKDSNFLMYFTRPYMTNVDSGHYSMFTPNVLILQSDKILDTLDILTFHGQLLFVSQNAKKAFIKKYYEIRNSHKRQNKKKRDKRFQEAILNNLYYDEISYHRRHDYAKWLIKKNDEKRAIK
jgi:hypothetical protein